MGKKKNNTDAVLLERIPTIQEGDYVSVYGYTGIFGCNWTTYLYMEGQFVELQSNIYPFQFTDYLSSNKGKSCYNVEGDNITKCTL